MRQVTIQAFGKDPTVLGAPYKPPADTTQTGIAISTQNVSRLGGSFILNGGTNIVGQASLQINNDQSTAPYLAGAFVPALPWETIGTLSITGNGSQVSATIPEVEISCNYVRILWEPSGGSGGTVQSPVKITSVGEA